MGAINNFIWSPLQKDIKESDYKKINLYKHVVAFFTYFRKLSCWEANNLLVIINAYF